MAGQVCERPREKEGKAERHPPPPSPRLEDKNKSRNLGVGLCSPGGWIEGCISPRARGGSPKGPSTPSRCPLFRDTPLLHVSLAPEPHPVGPLSRPLSTFPCLKQRGKVWEQKLAYALDRPLLPPVLLVIPLLGREPAAWNGLGSKRVSQLGPRPPPPPPPAPSPVRPPVWNELPNSLGSPFSLQIRPLSQGVPFRT